jgi:hypothetical protein
VLLHAALRLEVRYARGAFSAADRAEDDVRHGRRDRRVDECDALPRLALDVGEGAALGGGHEEERVDPLERGRQRCGVADLDARELDAAVRECLRPVGLGAAHEGADARTTGQKRVDDRSALFARPAEDGDGAG